MADDQGEQDGASRQPRTAGAEPTRTRRAFLAAGAAVTFASLSGCAGDGSDGADGGDGGDTATSGTPTYPDEVVIGSVHPFTGSTSYTGKRCHNAIDLAATIANENGGIESMDGAEVRVIKGDHKNDPTVGGEVTRELINEGADILTGTYSSRVTNAATQVAESEGVPFVIDVSVAASLLQERDLDYVYRTQPNSRSMAENCTTHTLAGTSQADLDASTAGLFYVDTTYGQAIRDGLKAALGETDLEIVAEETIGFGETADTQVTKLRQADPDVLFPTVFPNQLLELVSAMRDQDYWPGLFSACASGGMNRQNFEKMGDVINGALTTGYRIDTTMEKARRIDERFVNAYDTAPMESNQGIAYATGEVMIEAFEQAASAEADALNRALGNLEFADHIVAMPPISFTERGENANPLAVTSQVQDLKSPIVYPERYARTDLRTDTIGGL